MEQKKRKSQKGFAIVNIIMGVILVLASFAMFADPSTGPGGFISIAIGLTLWVTGAYAIKVAKKPVEEGVGHQKVRLVNTICFAFSCLILAACIILPIVGPML